MPHQQVRNGGTGDSTGDSSQAMFGYAFVNFVDELKALRARQVFEGAAWHSQFLDAVNHCHLTMQLQLNLS